MATDHPPTTPSQLADLGPVELFALLIEARDGKDPALADECAQLFAYRMLAQLDRWFSRRAKPHQVEELVGATIERVVRSTMRENSRFRGTTIDELYKWIYTIASNTLADHWRSPREQVEFVSIHQVDADGPDPADRIFHAEESGFAEVELLMIRDEVLAGFSPDHREVIMMRVYEDRSSAEVASATGKSTANVDQIKSRYGKAFRAALESTFGVGPDGVGVHDPGITSPSEPDGTSHN